MPAPNLPAAVVALVLGLAVLVEVLTWGKPSRTRCHALTLQGRRCRQHRPTESWRCAAGHLRWWPLGHLLVAAVLLALAAWFWFAHPLG